MGFVHQCSFCDFSRPAASAVMLPPGCPACGCALDAVEREEVERRARAAEPLPAPGPRATLAARILLVLFAVALLTTAARFGYLRGGFFGGMIACGCAGYLLLPFVPGRMAR